jgi:FAD/FMN-containing dehydrogenase
MVHNVLAIDAVTVAGQQWRFGPMTEARGEYGEFVQKLRGLYEREKAEIEARFPKLLRKVAGYNLDHLGPPHANAAHLLVGSEGTLAYSERILLKLSKLPEKRTLGVCHFKTFYRAMEVTQHIVKLGPSAVELVDRTMIGLARDPAFQDGKRVHQGDERFCWWSSQGKAAHKRRTWFNCSRISACPAWSRSRTRKQKDLGRSRQA